MQLWQSPIENRNIGRQAFGLDFNRHSRSHLLLRAAQEGIAFSFRYGIDIMNEMGLSIQVIRAGNANMFLSPIFRQTLANVPVQRLSLMIRMVLLGQKEGQQSGVKCIIRFRRPSCHSE